MFEAINLTAKLADPSIKGGKTFDLMVERAKNNDKNSYASENFMIDFRLKAEKVLANLNLSGFEVSLAYLATFDPFYTAKIESQSSKMKEACKRLGNLRDEELSYVNSDVVPFIFKRFDDFAESSVNLLKRIMHGETDNKENIIIAKNVLGVNTTHNFTEEVLDAAVKIVEAKKKEEEKLHQEAIEATATPVEEDQNAVAAYLPEGKEIVKRGRKPKAKENIKDAEIVEENFKVAKQVEPPKAVPLGSAAQPTQATVPPVPMPEKKGGHFDQVKQPDVFKVTLDPNNPSITFIPAEQQPQPQQAAPIVQPPVQQVQSDMPNLNNLIQPEEPVKDQKTFMGPKVKIVEDKPVEEFGLKPDVKVTTPPSQQIIDPPMPQPVNPQYATIPNMGNFKVVPPETNVNTGINNPILLFKENIGEVGFILTFGQYIVPKEIFTRLDYSNLVNTQFDCGIILCDITSIFGNPETYRMIKDITKNDYLPMFRYVGNNPSGRAVFYSEQVNGKTVRIEVIENNGTANISVKAI